jgi:hypothetical protein
MSVSLDQRIQDAYAAGFRGSALVTIVCISLCECGIGSATGCETGCDPDSGGESCGVLQIYQPAHPGTAACASNPPCCFTLGWQISSGGADFHPWTTFQDGCWAGHIAAVTAAINALPPPIGSSGNPPPPPPSGAGIGLLLAAGVVVGAVVWSRRERVAAVVTTRDDDRRGRGFSR